MQTSDLPRLLFLGYQMKVPWKPDPRWDPENETGMVEVCSVSECISKRAPNWIQHWTHNRAWCHSTPEEALATIPAGEGDRYDLFVVTWERRELVHSPLSCNHMAQEFEVNRFCLVPDLKEALRLVEAFTNEKCEPGPYLAVRVARVPR